MGNRLPSSGDFIAGAVFFAVALAALVEAFRMPLYGEGVRGIVGSPSLTPAILSLGMLLVSIALMVRSRGATIRLSSVSPAPGGGRVLTMFLLAGGYAAALPFVGYTIATFVALATFQVAFSQRRSWRYFAVVVFISALLAVMLKILFSRFFFIPLPGEILS